MSVHCPNCGSKHVRQSRKTGLGESLMVWLGFLSLRCKDCTHRFRSHVWKFRDLFYSKCPRCYRMDLSAWSEEHYSARFGTRFIIRLGAKRLRCEYCRCNFAGFRPVRQKYKARPPINTAASARAHSAVRQEALVE